MGNMSIIPIIPNRPMEWPELVDEIRSLLYDEEIYLVGGAVRDVYLRRPVHDLDMAVSGDGRPIARRIANAFDGAYYALDASRGVGRALIDWAGVRWTVDVAQFRGNDLLADLRDRDFTVNAVAADLRTPQHVIDPLGGLGDMESRIVRLCRPDSIARDPVRALRAVRLSLARQMRIAPETKNAARHDGAQILQVSAERIRDELFKLLDGPKPTAAIMALDSLGLLQLILPETSAMKGIHQSPPHVYDVWRHTLSVIDFLDKVLKTVEGGSVDSANFALGMVVYTFSHLRGDLREYLRIKWPNERTHRALLVLAALAHDVAKPLTQSVGGDGRIDFYRHEEQGESIAGRWAVNLALSSDEMARLQKIVRHHMRPFQLSQNNYQISRRAIYRFWRDLGAAGVDVCLLTMADHLGKVGATLDQETWLAYLQMIRVLLEGYFREREVMVEITPLVNGHDLMKHLKMKPGPLLGKLVAALREAQALAEITTSDEALEWAARWLEDRPDMT